MKWLSLLAVAAFLAGEMTAQADQTSRVPAAQGGTSDAPSYMAPVGTAEDMDFPRDCYPPGFSSYRGLGFMGSCCQPCSPCAQQAWDGYCEGLECDEPAPYQSFLAKLHAWMRPPAWACGPKGCDPCSSPDVKPSPFASTFHEPLCVKLQRLRAQCAGMFGGCRAGGACDPWFESGQTIVPETTPLQESAEPPPQPAVPEAPAPQATGETRPRRTRPPTTDRSAWRWSPWQLPSSRNGT